MKHAISVLGINRQRYEVANMERALSIGSYSNTPDETERLEVARIVLAQWPAYQQACNAIRDGRK